MVSPRFWPDDAKLLNLFSKPPIFASNAFLIPKKDVSLPCDCSAHNGNTSIAWVKSIAGTNGFTSEYLRSGLAFALKDNPS